MFVRLFLCMLLAFSGLTGPLSACAQEGETTESDIKVLDARWGFDGFSRHKTFIPLRIIIKNTGPTNKTIRVRLTREDSLSNLGEVLEQEVLLSAETTRIIQMTPFVSDPGETWTFRWGDTAEESLPIKGQTADDGLVFITSTRDLIHRSGTLRTMPEDEFPTSVTALDALRVVVLDQEPRWTGARRKAFQDWLIKGGKVVILDQPDHTAPKFANGFEYLNVSRLLTSYGRGSIQRITLSAQDVSQKLIEKQILGRKITAGDLDQKLAAYDASRWDRYQGPMTRTGQSKTTTYSRDAVLTSLKDLAGARRYWGLIYLAILLYTGFQWRNGWRRGLMEKQPRPFYAWLVGLSLGFSLLFFAFGQIGAAGQDRVRTIVIAHRITEGQYDVEGWSVLGTGLSGGDHVLSIPGSGQLYGGTESFGQNPMRIAEGRMRIDLPAYSTQKIAIRTRVEMPDIPVRLFSSGPEMWQSKSAKIELDPADKARVYAAVVVINNSVYEFSGKSGTLKSTENWGLTMQEWINPFSFRNMKRSQWRTSLIGWLFDTRTSDDIYMNAFADVVGNGFCVGPTVFPDSFQVPAGYARVMLFTEIPPELKYQGDFPDQAGRMLYVVDLPLQGGQ